MKSEKFLTLVNQVISNSNSETFEAARLEWKITAYHTVNIEENISCICGQPHLVNLYEITNIYNKNSIYPLGSECITKFEYDDLNYQRKLITTGKKRFINKGKRFDGLTYEEICNTYPDYLEFLMKHATKSKYIKLIEYYKFIKNIKLQ